MIIKFKVYYLSTYSNRWVYLKSFSRKPSDSWIAQNIPCDCSVAKITRYSINGICINDLDSRLVYF